MDLEIICSFEGKRGKNKGVAYAALNPEWRRDRSVRKSSLKPHFVSPLRLERRGQSVLKTS